MDEQMNRQPDIFFHVNITLLEVSHRLTQMSSCEKRTKDKTNGEVQPISDLDALCSVLVWSHTGVGGARENPTAG